MVERQCVFKGEQRTMANQCLVWVMGIFELLYVHSNDFFYDFFLL